jgi:transcriptional regulator with XRE-family HTH domain
MKIGGQITELRKEKSLSQTEFASKVGVSREMIGRYERNEVLPSIEVAKKMADALDVSLDYLVGASDKSNKMAYDKRTLNLIYDIEGLEPTVKDKLLYLAQAIIRDAKTQLAYK